MKVTINEVARESGVSITTVSRVLNNNYPVKKETREKIEKAIEKLNYRPNAMARSLITKRTSTIGIVVPGITNLFFPTIVESIGDYIKNFGYSIYLSSTGGDCNCEQELIDNMISKQVDGIVVMDPTEENLENEFYSKISEVIPIVIINASAQMCRCNFVCYNEEVGTKEAFSYLLGLGHKRIAFIRGKKSLSYEIKEKIYKDMIKTNALKYKKILNVGEGNSIEVVEKSQKEIESLLCSEDPPTAIFACNDLMAVGVINTCSKLKIKIPEELSVIGFDNTLISEITNPKLTTVDQNMKDIAYRAADELIDIIEKGTNIRKNVLIDTRLIKRESCGSAKDAVK